MCWCPADHSDSGEIFWTFARPAGRAAALEQRWRAASWTEQSCAMFPVIWELTPGSRGGRHFGSRVVEGADGLPLSSPSGIGANGPPSQDLRVRKRVTLVRVEPRWNHPRWTTRCHRIRGCATGYLVLWAPQPARHGCGQPTARCTWSNMARGAGMRSIAWNAGLNYGWPLVAFGRHYSRAAGSGSEPKLPGMEPPLHVLGPVHRAVRSCNLSRSDMFPDWQGDLLVGALAFDLISRVDPDAEFAEAERIETAETARVRDVRVAPDGAIWFLSVGQRHSLSDEPVIQRTRLAARHDFYLTWGALPPRCALPQRYFCKAKMGSARGSPLVRLSALGPRGAGARCPQAVHALSHRSMETGCSSLCSSRFASGPSRSMTAKRPGAVERGQHPVPCGAQEIDRPGLAL